MAQIIYVKKNFGPDALEIIAQARRICERYQRDGYDLTLRQLYYQFVARGLIANTERSYKRLGGIINDARLAGLIDWDHIVDRTRNVRANPTWKTPAQLMRNAAGWWETDKWAQQPTVPEVWIEKDALQGVISGVCEQHQVAHFSCRGYTSQSELWAAAQRIGQVIRSGRNVTVIHLGDHDPSGIDMSRDIEDRLRLFITHDNTVAIMREMRDADPREYQRLCDARDDNGHLTELMDRVAGLMAEHHGDLEVRRIALTMDQIEEYGPPPNPAKLTDSRARGYLAEHGDESWELDALEPQVLADLVETHILSVRDDDAWDQAVDEQEAARDHLTRAAQYWSDIVTWLDTAPEEDSDG